MKTFEEAVKLLEPGSRGELEAFYLKYLCLSEDVKACAILTKLIQEYQKEMRCCCLSHAQADAAAQMRCMFHFGLVVGIEMTKVDE